MGLNFIFNLSKISNLSDYKLSINEDEKVDMAIFLEILEIKKLDCNINLSKIDNKNFLFNCCIDTIFTQECSITSESLTINKKINFHRLIESKFNISYKDELDNIKDDNIYFIFNNNLCIKDIVLEEMLLNIDPYIKKEDKI